MSSVSNDPYQFWCNTCSKKLSCAHQGKADIIWSQGFLDFLVGRPGNVGGAASDNHII